MPSNGFPRHLPNLLSPYLAGFPVKQSSGDSSISARLCRGRKKEEDESGLAPGGVMYAGQKYLAHVTLNMLRKILLAESGFSRDNCHSSTVCCFSLAFCHL